MKSILVFALVFAMAWPTMAQVVLTRKDIAAIIEQAQDKEYADFQAFLADISKRTIHPVVKNTGTKFKDGGLDQVDRDNLYRLAGIYARCKYRDDMLATLKELVGIPTDSLPGVYQHDNPNMIKFGSVIERIAGEFGLAFRNTDDRVFEVILKGSANMDESFGIYTHGDVVPADKEKWVLEDRTQLDPYRMQIIGDKIYGRGTEDDKASIVSALFAMKTIHESRLEIKRDVRLIIETTEEIGGSGFKYYAERHKIPEYNVVLDNLYPVVTAEKGFLIIYADFKVTEASGEGIEVVNITGGTSLSQIPASSTVTLRTTEPAQVKAQLDLLAGQFIRENGKDFRIESRLTEKNTLALTVFGTSAHSSVPWTGVNPIPLAFVFLHTAKPTMPFRENHFTDAIRYVYDNYGLDYYGKKMGIDYSDDFMGPLTISLTTISLTADRLRIGVSGRPPKGKAVADLKTEVETKLSAYKRDSSVAFGQELRVYDFMYRNPEGKWLDILLDIYGDVTGNEAKPISANGGTTAKLLPNGVCFGPSLPGEKYMGHNANEFKKISNLLLDTQMITEMILRIGNVDEMIQ
jgi:predicted dipeptidase